jgi:hypothetical protein
VKVRVRVKLRDRVKVRVGVKVTSNSFASVVGDIVVGGAVSAAMLLSSRSNPSSRLSLLILLILLLFLLNLFVCRGRVRARVGYNSKTNSFPDSNSNLKSSTHLRLGF